MTSAQYDIVAMLTGSAADHTGLDIVAYHPVTKRRLGITVKSRTRVSGSESTSVTIFKPKEGPRQKLRKACEAFACEPWVAVYVETDLSAHLYLTSLEHYDHKYRVAEPASQDTWKMGNLLTGQYLLDPELQHVSVTFDETKWSWPAVTVVATGRRTSR